MKKDLEKEKNISFCYFNIYKNISEQTKLEIEDVQNQIEYCLRLQRIKEEEKPLSFFKKKYNIWLKEMDDLDKKINELYQELNQLYVDYFEKHSDN